MGSIYRPKYRRPDGTTAKSAVWWIKYYANGAPVRESTKTTKKTLAENMLKQKEGDAARGLPVVPKVNRKTVGELLKDVLADYRNHERDTLDKAERCIEKYLAPFFGNWNAASVTDDQVRKYIEERKAAGAANATINRELAFLRRGYSLNRRAVTASPEIPRLKENNARKGFFERAEFEAVRGALPAYLQSLLTIAYVTGWRIKSELLPMEWRQVDFKNRTLRLEPGTTKNDEGREFPFTAELEAALRAQREYTDTVQKKRGAIIPHVFHRDGTPVHYWRRPWLQALLKVGLAHREAGEDGTPKKRGKIIPHVIPHDFRRTAIRALVRAGVSEAVAMKLCGHETRSVFDRYNVTTNDDLRIAAQKLDAAAVTFATGKVAGKVAVFSGDEAATGAAKSLKRNVAAE